MKKPIIIFILLFSSLSFAKQDLSKIDARAIAKKADDVLRGKSSISTFEMHIKTAHWEREMTIKAWTKGMDQTLILIEKPVKEKGTATLKVGKNIWNFLPKVKRTIKLPTSMMSRSWMGTHFTNDDLIKESTFLDDYTFKLVAIEDYQNTMCYKLEFIPKPTAPVVWGKIVLWARKTDYIPLLEEYYDEKGNKIRVMLLKNIKKMHDRIIPTEMVLIPQDKPEEFTKITYLDIKFDVGIKDSFFSLRNLKNR